MSSKHENAKRFKKLLPRGTQGKIARDLGLHKSAVSQALDTLNPNHPAVQQAVRIARKNEAAETQRMLDELLNPIVTGSELAAAAS